MSNIIHKYISTRYDRWLDYAKYHCSHYGMDEESIDVLNEVLVMLLEKLNTNEEYIIKLYDSKKGEYRELDFYILQMIKLNITSETSPYRHKYKSLPIDENTDFQLIDIIDHVEDETDKAGYLLEQMHVVREIFDTLNLSAEARKIFSYKFFEGEQFSNWPGTEDKKYLYSIYNGVVRLIKNKLNGSELF